MVRYSGAALASYGEYSWLTIVKTSSGTWKALIRKTFRTKQDAKDWVRRTETELAFFAEPGRDGIRRPYLFDKAWTDAKRAAGLEDFHFHDLRHEAVSRFVKAGLSDQEVSAISGHKSMQMLKHYMHFRAEDLVQKLDNLTRTDKLLLRKIK